MDLYTYTGRIAYPGGAPSLLDIAVSLSRECRYAGAGQHWWPVALHTFVVCDLLPMEDRVHGLLHDASECITGDIPRTIKTNENKQFEDEVLDAIYAGLGVGLPSPAVVEKVHAADRLALCGEVWTVGAKALQALYPRHERAEELVRFYRGCFPVEECVEPTGRAVREFMWRFYRYTGREDEFSLFVPMSQ
jgi:hypothetical protein